MGRLLVMCVTAAVGLELCDEPVGPQPDKPIRPPYGYTGEPPGSPPGRPPPAQPPPGEAAQADASARQAPRAPEPEPVKCPTDIATVLTAKAKNAKDKKKRIKLELGAKNGAPALTFKKVTKMEDGTAEDVKADGATLTTFVDPANPKGKVKLTLGVACGWEDRVLALTLDPKSLGVTMKEVPPPPEPGYLNVLAEAGVKVTASGKDLGMTPLRNVPLAPGKYQLTLQPKKGKPKTVAVEIRSAQASNVDLDPKDASPKKK